jgi:GTPase KRas protein
VRCPLRVCLVPITHQREACSDCTITEGQALARQFGCKFIETSAKSRRNVDQAFFDIVREIRRFNKEMSSYGSGAQSNSPPGKMEMDGHSEKRSCACCTVM